MAAPPPQSTPAISSTGRTDGLGRRELCLDRQTGDTLERLHVRPELAVFEAAIRQRIDRLATFSDPRFATVRAVERLDDGSFTVLSNFIPGRTLADLLDTAADLAIVPGLDTALGYLIEGLYAVAALHRATAGAHGLIAPERTLFTSDGDLIFLDTPYATAIEHLGLSRRRLWDDYGIRGHFSTAGGPLAPLDDVGQVAISAVMLILGRRLAFEDLERLPEVIAEVVEVALIRGPAPFAQDLQRLLERLLPLPGHSPYASADEASATLRDLLQRGIGLDACRTALVDFVAQCGAGAAEDYAGRVAPALEADDFSVAPPVDPTPVLPPLDELDAAEQDAPASIADAFSFGSRSGGPIRLVPGVEAPEPARFGRIPEAAAFGEVIPAVRSPESLVSATAPNALVGDTEPTATRSGTRHKRPGKSALVPKDSLRSATQQEPAASPVVGDAPATVPASGWLVPPESHAGSEPATRKAALSPPHRTDVELPPPAPIELPFATPTSAASRPAIVPLAPVAFPPPPASAPLPTFGNPPLIQPVAPSATSAPSISLLDPQGVFAPVKLKPEAGSGHESGGRGPTPADHAWAVVEEPPEEPPLDEVTIPAEPTPRVFPFKLAIALIVLVVLAVVVGRARLPGGMLGKRLGDTAALAATDSDQPDAQVRGPGSGQIFVNTQPPGARIALDGRAVGVSPVTLDAIAAGMHELTITSSAGSVKRTIRVVADHAINVDVPIFSGWVAVYAPFAVTVAEGSRILGTTTQGRLMAAPGHHRLSLSNAALGFVTEREVDVTAGDAAAAIHLDPRGAAKINASPWAEVWWDGRMIGNTPIASYSLPIGRQEFLFRHPQLGERRLTAIVRADEPAILWVDFSKTPQP